MINKACSILALAKGDFATPPNLNARSSFALLVYVFNFKDNDLTNSKGDGEQGQEMSRLPKPGTWGQARHKSPQHREATLELLPTTRRLFIS